MKQPGDDFASWYGLEWPGVTQALGLALGDMLLAEEASAEAFSRAFVRWEQVRAMASPVGWVYRVALNDARSRHRRRRLEQRVSHAQAGAPMPTVPAPADPDAALWLAVSHLPERARTAVALRYIADLPEPEIASLMGVTRGTVSATLGKARKEIAAALAEAAPLEVAS